MNKSKIFWTGALHALGVALYVSIVATFMMNGERIVGKAPGIIGPVMFLMLFVLSASITGVLVLGRPILLYVEGQKKQAIQLLFTILFWIAVFVFLAMASLALRSNV